MKLTPERRSIILAPKPVRKNASGQELLIAHRNQAMRAALLSDVEKQNGAKGDAE